MIFKQVAVVTKLQAKDIRPQTRRTHHKTLKDVTQFLKKLEVPFRVLDRSRLKKIIGADLIITVGGDGTVLAASHHSEGTPIFGINSAPQTSTGFFCLAGPKNFKRHLKKIMTGKRKPKLIPRLVVFLGKRRLTPFGLNELLFASRLQGETARYWICLGRKKEWQKSSGVWVSTGAGSTGAIHSAGGKPCPLLSTKLQYLVREACRFPKNNYHLLQGFLNAGRTIKIISGIEEGTVFIDGGKWHYRVPKNGVITVRGGVSPLPIFL